MDHINPSSRLDPAINSLFVNLHQGNQGLLGNTWELIKAFLNYSCLVTDKMVILSHMKCVTKCNGNQITDFRLLSRYNLK